MQNRIALHWQILAALVLSTLTAMVFRMLASGGVEGGGVDRFIAGVIDGCHFVGGLFMRSLKMLVVPVVVTSVISGICKQYGGQGLARLGGKTALFFVSTSLVAILLGLVLVNVICPGLDGGKPDLVIRQAFEQSRSAVSPDVLTQVEAAEAQANGAVKQMFYSILPENVIVAVTHNSQLLGMMVFSILFALALTQISYGQMINMQQIFKSASDAMVVLTGWVMLFAPVGVYALILPVVYSSGAGAFLNFGKFFFTVIAGLVLHLFVILPAILYFIGKVNPWLHFRSMRPALLLAFSTASSSTTLPVTMRCVEHGCGVSKRVSSLTLPLGATANMGGSALYVCVAVIFVAQVMGAELSFATQFFILIAALMTSFGVAGLPSASLVAILLILESSNIHGADLAVCALLAVDRLLDMARTAVNVFSDSCAAVVIAQSEGEQLPICRSHVFTIEEVE